ncbi:glycoside hydrolase family 71/99-like protein [Mucilaginibacter corticis]|uniref:glycoside hydrolase family 71/99-like protein n=1 Tax=Mucilaginibacter corticis TaxID=2597670 RepID=UPI001FECC2AF|nr:glycoside hydrolase family 71/99-like protein [Mucilaginibacter corticis]
MPTLLKFLKPILIVLLIAVFKPDANAQAPKLRTIQAKHSKKTMYLTYKGLIMAGYQGWFRAEGDGSNSRQYAYGDENSSGIDLWPDVREYEKTYQTPFKLGNGQSARFFSSYDQSSVDLHFKWMQQYGIDGVFVQRFFNNAKKENRTLKGSTVIRNEFEAASKYKRAIAVMYDLSGLAASGEDCSSIIEDWKYLVDEIKVTNQSGAKTYLHENGKPIVAIWGVGFPDRPYNIRNIGLERLIDFLKNDPVYGDCEIMLGVPNAWRTLRADCLPDPYLHDIIKQCDIVLPWSVQRYSPLLHNDMDRYRDDIMDDMKWCADNKLEYVPCVYPGFSWHNVSRREFPDDIKPVGSIPREGGRFYWQMLSTAMKAGAQMLYVAMFDEINEGTAIFKVTDNPPVMPEGSPTMFLGLEGKPSDLYLKLTGEAAKMLRKEKPLTFKKPQL